VRQEIGLPVRGREKGEVGTFISHLVPAIRAAYHAELRALVYGAMTASKAAK
jgi:hypothetical protein